MPAIDFPPELTEAWFKKNLPFKDKQFAGLLKLVQDFETMADDLATKDSLPATGKVMSKSLAIANEARKLEAVKGLTKIQLGHLADYSTKAKLVLNILTTLTTVDRSDKDARMSADNEMRVTAIAIKAAVDGVAKFKPAFDKLLAELDETADKTKKAELKEKLKKVYAGLEKLLVKPKEGSWELRWKALQMSTSPAKFKKPAAAPKAADVEKLGATLRILIQTRDKVIKDYERAK